MHLLFASYLLSLCALATTLIAAPSPGLFRVMSYNIHHAEGIDGRLDVERIAKLITGANADIVALQEVDRGTERTARRDLSAELARLTGMNVHFEKNIPYQGGEYGNAVLTRFPIRNARNTLLPLHGAGEQRGALQVVLNVHGRDVLLINTHLDQRRDESERLMSAEALQRIVAAAGSMPVIVCGDFNALPQSRTIEIMRGFLTDAWTVAGKGDGFTIPVKNPARRIDYLWISPETIEPLQMLVLHSEASDHLPLVGEFRLK
jgi:endonuclease/exonuclease/phosphatase family metal-dependent hydrolase